jgi:hypothetical protein
MIAAALAAGFVLAGIGRAGTSSAAIVTPAERPAWSSA